LVTSLIFKLLKFRKFQLIGPVKESLTLGVVLFKYLNFKIFKISELGPDFWKVVELMVTKLSVFGFVDIYVLV